jgi:hypothetical protein
MGAAFISLIFLSASSAHAANRAARERAARKACLAGDASTGVDILAELFVETKNATYLFNQGRCFEQNRRYADAAARFEEYLRAPDLKLSAEDRASAERHIADCRDKLAKERDESPLQPTPPQVATPMPAPPVLEAAPLAVAPDAEVATAAPSAAPVGERSWGLVTAGIITGAVGVGGIVTGLIFNLKANNAVNDMQNTAGAWSTSKSDQRKKDETLAWVGYGAGAACAVVGAILIGVGASRSSPGSSSEVSLSPTFGVGQFGAVLTGGF